MKNPNTLPQPAQGQELDPLEELARIMNDTKTPNPNERAGDAPADDDAAAQGDPLDLGLGDQGLEELFQNQSFGSDDLLAANDLDPAVPQGPDDLLSTLDFSDLDLPPLEESALGDQPPVDQLPLPTFENFGQQSEPAYENEPVVPDEPAPPPQPVETESLPSLTEHLTPRPIETPEPAIEPGPPPMTAAQPAHVGEDDLLAAMDALALDEPNQPASTAPPLGLADMAPQPLNQPQSQPPVQPQPLQQPAPSLAAPAFDGGHDLGPQSFEEAASFQDNDHSATGRTGLGRKVIYALAGVAVIGLGGVFAFGLFSGDPAGDDAPQLIAATEGDNKVEPEIASDTPTRPGDAAFSALESDGAASSETPRVVLPGPSNEGLPAQSSQRLPSADIAPAPPGSTASRAVRTVTVRADGTVVESTSQPVAEAPDVQVPDIPEVPGTAPRSVETVSVSPGTAPAATQSPAQSLDQTFGQEPLQQPSTQGQAALQSALEEAAQTATQTTTQAAQPTPVGEIADRIAATLATPPPQPVARPESTPVQTQPIRITPAQPAQSTRQVEPIQLATPAAAPTQPAVQQAAPQPATPAALPASVPAGEFIVQLASLRTEEEARATFGRLQNRFGSILSGFSPNIQRADLGERGIYHRVRLGPMDRAAADSLCSRYQSAGGDCFVQRQ